MPPETLLYSSVPIARILSPRGGHAVCVAVLAASPHAARDACDSCPLPSPQVVDFRCSLVLRRSAEFENRDNTRSTSSETPRGWSRD
jgi:hypothetical protein